MSRNTKISAILVAAFAIVIAAVAVTSRDDKTSGPGPSKPTTTQTQSGSTPEARFVAPDPRSLGSTGSSSVTVTEFLDFECEACGAAYPMIEQLREQYKRRVTFNIRYFPIDGHRNARTSAAAVDAAAHQDRLEDMYKRMYETQTTWGAKEDTQAPVFRKFAADMGLDMKAFDKAVADPKTAARVERDVQAGIALGVQGTPSFFINEERIEPESFDDLRSRLDDALSGS